MTWAIYEGSGPQHAKVEVLNLQTKTRVVFLGGPESAVKVFIHWTEDGSRPCAGEGCSLCPTERRPQAFCPVLVERFDTKGNRYCAEAIACITFGGMGVVDQAKRGSVVEFFRRGNHRTGALMWKMIGDAKDVTHPVFDVAKRLEEMWHKQDVKKAGKERKKAKSGDVDFAGSIGEST